MPQDLFEWAAMRERVSEAASVQNANSFEVINLLGHEQARSMAIRDFWERRFIGRPRRAGSLIDFKEWRERLRGPNPDGVRVTVYAEARG